MYHMRNIISFDGQLDCPKNMYHLRNPIASCEVDETGINVTNQVIKFLKNMPKTQLIELEDRQDKLLLKLDVLYERIKNISNLCKSNTKEEGKPKIVNTVNPEEVVIVLHPESLPWFLNIFVKETQSIQVSWHIHSSVPATVIPSIKAFFKKFDNLYTAKGDTKINLRLIFRGDSPAPELKISSLAVPILGVVNIIRFLCLTYENIAPYDYCNHEVDGLLDLCYQLETASAKNKESLIAKIFSNTKEWIYKNEFSIVDLVMFNIIKQIQNGNKYVPKKWFTNCEKKL